MAVNRSQLRRAVRTRADKALTALAPRLGPRSGSALVAVADKFGVGPGVSARLADEAQRRLADQTTRASGIGLAEALLRRPQLAGGRRAGLADAVREVGQSDVVADWERQLSAQVEALSQAADAGDADAFYEHLTEDAKAGIPADELVGVASTLGASCGKKRQFRAAADAYHYALTLEPANKHYKERYLAMRRRAPEWGFHTPDAKRGWRMSDYPDAATDGLVAPIRQPVYGWLPASAKGARVTFKLNGTAVADTRATVEVTLPDGNRYLQFSRYLKDLWTYAGAGDQLTVEANGRTLTMIRHGQAYSFKRKESRADELLAKLADGEVFNKYGRVKPAISDDSGWQASMVDSYARLREDVDEILGVDLFPFYGTMLGAVREQGFITTDNDFDTIYISKFTEPGKVRAEFKKLCHGLLDRGYDLKVKSTHTWVKIAGSPDKIDIFFSWFRPDGAYAVSYGYHGAPLRKSDEFFQMRGEKLGEFEIPVPANAEAILAQLYGEEWRIPDPGFRHATSSRQIDRRYLLTTGDLTELHWSQFYRDHEPDRASRFAGFVADRFDTAGTVVEFGCGSGRDGIHFAHRGWTAFCCDRSPEAITRASNVVAASDRLSATFETVDAASTEEVQSFLATHAAGSAADPLVVYLRFFLHAIDEKAQETLLDAITGALPRDFYLCAEFRTVADRKLTKHHGQHYRRYIDHEQLAEQLRDRWGFEIEHLEAGQGLSPYDGEDPHLARIVAVRRGD